MDHPTVHKEGRKEIHSSLAAKAEWMEERLQCTSLACGFRDAPVSQAHVQGFQ